MSMNIANNVEVALNGVKANKLRSALTMLGIIIGISAVIIMISVGQGVTKNIQDQISSMGSNLLMVMPGTSQGGPVRGAGGNVTTLTLADAKAIAALDNVVNVSPELSSNATITYSNQTYTSQYTGVTPEYQLIKDWSTGSGSFFTDDDVTNAASVAVLGQTVVDNLFVDGTDPIGTTIRIDKISFTVVGVLTSKSTSSVGQDQDDAIFVPVTTAQRRLMGVNYVRMIDVQTENTESMDSVQSNIETLLRERHRITGTSANDFNVRNMADVLATVESTSATMTLFLGGVAAISLLVGGIGIMNIMLVSVTERTREIGLRMAVGATEGDIRNQFLVESLALCLAGGLVGIIVGVGGSKLVSMFTDWNATVNMSSIILSTGFSAAIGIFFGYYPAKKAAGLDPIEALRSE